MTQQPITEQLAKLVEIVEAAKIAEQKTREMSELATAIAQKYQKRLHEIGQAYIAEQSN